MKKYLVLACVLFTFSAMAKDVIKIEIGDDYKSYSNKELRKRIWRLERAVWQLQEKVFDLQHSSRTKPLKEWNCSVSALGDYFSAAGETKAIAKAKVIKKCSKKQDSFFCKDAKCEK